MYSNMKTKGGGDWKDRTHHLFSQNPATNTENSAQSRSEHIFMELTLFVYNINSQ